MSQNKTAKLLQKALNNSSKEEALTAFAMAWSMANRDGIQLSSIHKITEEAAPQATKSSHTDQEYEECRKRRAELFIALTNLMTDYNKQKEELKGKQKEIEGYKNLVKLHEKRAEMMEKLLKDSGIM